MFQTLLSKGHEDSKDVQHSISRVTLDVEHLSYSPPPPSLINSFRESVLSSGMAPQMVNDRVTIKLHSEVDSEIIDVSFRALPGKFTAVISQEPAERKTLMELISGRRIYGEFDGKVTLLQSKNSPGALNADTATAYVPREAVSLYMPGLSYVEMVTYAARLRMIDSALPSSAIERRVMEVMTMMNLLGCKDRIITERPTSRGSLGGELRKMAIACEIVNFAPVLVFDDITSDLDEQVANEILGCLQVLSQRGHTVVASFQNPHMQAFEVFNSVVLMCNGRSIYSSTVDNICPFFCTHSAFNYSMPDTPSGGGGAHDVGKFLMDIASGTERPHGLRVAPEALDLQSSFESSQFFNKRIGSDSSWSAYDMVDLLPERAVSYWEVLCDFNTGHVCQQSAIQFKRAVYLKLRERSIMQKLLVASVTLSLVFGYVVFDMTSDYDYCMSLLGFPYPEVMTLTGCLYVFHVVPFGMQVLNAHIFHQKLNVFLFERRGKWASTVGYLFSSVIPEVFFAVSYVLVFSNIVYFMSSLNEGWEAYKYYMGLMMAVGALGTATLLLATAFFRHEIAVRNFWVFALSITVMTSGMMYTFPIMRPFFKTNATINPFRWTFPALMVWMWERYPDGANFLHSYNMEGFDKDRVWEVLTWFFLVDMVLYVYLLFPERVSLHRRAVSTTAADRKFMSMDSDLDEELLSSQRSLNSRGSSGLLKPQILSRESSFSAKQVLSTKTSSFGNDDVNDSESRGPRVSFVDLAYRVPDKDSPQGRKQVLHKMSGRFEWGKLSVIMGAEGAGKSSLLHIIGGQKLSSGAEISGKVFLNDRSLDGGREKAWQKCAFVEALDSHYRDLTVGEVVQYALELRNHEENMNRETFLQTVEQTCTLLQLSELANTKAKYLTAGETRRLSLAEEIVVGPMLVLLDEPITGLDAREASIIITQTLREIVNQDRTVVCTMHQPSAEVFGVFDTLVLLSKGHLVYIGPAEKALDFFISSPTLGISNSSFTNPAEFLFGISGGFVLNNHGAAIDTETLENHYRNSTAFGYYNGVENVGTGQGQGKMLSKAGGDDHGDDDEVPEWRCASFDGAAPDSFVRRSMNYSKAQPTGPSYWDLMFLKYFVPLMAFFHDLAHIDFVANTRRSSVLLRRATRVLLQRPRMVVFSTMTHIATALVMVYIIVDNQEYNAAVLTPTAAFGGFLLMMMNIQFAFFLFNNQKVFLREHSRDLYSTFLRWLVEPLPLLLLRSIQGFVFALIVHEGIGLQGGEVGMYFYLMTWFMCLACTMIIETICYTLKDMRDVYGAIIMTALTLFLFSGLFFKPSTLPGWMGPWLPSISIIRWYSQGIINNEYDGNLHAFPVLPLPSGDLSLYGEYLSLFGWGGKSKWYSFNCVVYNLIGFRLVQLIVCWKTTVSQRGERCLMRKEMAVDKIY